MGAVTGSLQGIVTLRARLPAEGTAGTGGEYVIGQVPSRRGAITGARYMPDVVVTGAATNNKTLSVRNRGTGGAGTTSTAAITFGNGTNAAAFVATSLTLDAVLANRDVPASSILTLISTVNGTGMTLPASSLEVDFTFD